MKSSVGGIFDIGIADHGLRTVFRLENTRLVAA
jgi:hypothetical protein